MSLKKSIKKDNVNGLFLGKLIDSLLKEVVFDDWFESHSMAERVLNEEIEVYLNVIDLKHLICLYREEPNEKILFILNNRLNGLKKDILFDLFYNYDLNKNEILDTLNHILGNSFEESLDCVMQLDLEEITNHCEEILNLSFDDYILNKKVLNSFNTNNSNLNFKKEIKNLDNRNYKTVLMLLKRIKGNKEITVMSEKHKINKFSHKNGKIVNNFNHFKNVFDNNNRLVLIIRQQIENSEGFPIKQYFLVNGKNVLMNTYAIYAAIIENNSLIPLNADEVEKSYGLDSATGKELEHEPNVIYKDFTDILSKDYDF